MTDIGRIISDNYENYDSSSNQANNQQAEDVKLEDVSILYTTTDKNEERTSFSDSFTEVPKEDSSQGNTFLEALKDADNKSDLMEALGITEEQYNSLAFTALAIASHETGMGEENGYKSENEGIGGFFRSVLKWGSTTFGHDGSASSGLTQMKINDFIKSDSFPDAYKDILADLGVETKGKNKNNLFENPDKAALATMVVLKSINDSYGNYMQTIEGQHQASANELANLPEGLEAAIQDGQKLFDGIMNTYQNAPEDQKKAIRDTFQSWLLSVNGTKIEDKKTDKNYNEELQMQNLNKLLEANNADFQLDDTSLQKLRYVLTSQGNEMSHIEYMAYGWNKGPNLQIDRLLAEKVGSLMTNPDDIDENERDNDLYTAVVTAIAERYANQSVGRNGFKILNDAF